MKLAKDKLSAALLALAREAKVLVPATVDGVRKFVPYEQGVAYDFSMVNTVLPPKDALFPQTEKMFCFTKGAEPTVEETVNSEAQIIFGLRPCDVQSFDCLDKVFLTKTFVDSYYAKKREDVTLVAMGCTEAKPTCFCTSMGLDPAQARSADILLIPTAEGWNVITQSEKGKQLAAALQGIVEEGEGKPLPAAEPTLTPDMEGVPQKLARMFEHPIWEEIYRPCLACGICTYTCPTCYCFEFEAELKGDEGSEYRCWDSCMFSEYTRMAGGHNPRPTQKERVRNRYLHKLSYFEDRYGQSLCVGCGRCIDECPVGMDITQVIDLAKEAELV